MIRKARDSTRLTLSKKQMPNNSILIQPSCCPITDKEEQEKSKTLIVLKNYPHIIENLFQPEKKPKPNIVEK